MEKRGTRRSESPSINDNARVYGGELLQSRLNGSPIPSVSSTPRKDGRTEEPRTYGTRTNPPLSTPSAPMLNSNVTPRSSARKARRESALSTPDESTATRFQAAEGRASGYITPALAPSKKRSTFSDGGRRPTLHHSYSGGSSANGTEFANSENAPRFFHANDACSILSPRSPSPATSPVYEKPQPKFFHVNGDTDTHTPAYKAAPASKLKQSPRPYTPSPQTPNSRPPRAPSPLKEEIVSRKPSVTKPSPRRHTRLVSNGSTAAERDIKPPESIVVISRSSSRRSSLSSPVPNGIARPKSLTLDKDSQMPMRRASLTLSDVSINPPATPRSRPSSAAGRVRRCSAALGDQQDTSRSRPVLATIPSQSLPQVEDRLPMSPVRTSEGQSKLEHMNELAANARRDRKVLDLEISNSSLLAINRTLEREMRKQKEELRNLRRFARSASGRISSRGTSGRISDLSGPRTSDLLSEGLSDDQLSDVDDQHSLSSTDTSSPPTSECFPSGIPRIRQSTQSQALKKIHLEDLARQRALLIDGQKLNQAIKRCLDSTETLIADGKKALIYKAEVEETESRVGGKVLTRDMEDESPHQDGAAGWTGMRQGLLSPAIEWPPSKNPWEPQDFAPTPTMEDLHLPSENRILSEEMESSPIEVDANLQAGLAVREIPSPEQALPGKIERLGERNNDGSYSPPASPLLQPTDSAALPINLPSDPLPQSSSSSPPPYVLPSSSPLSPNPSNLPSSPPLLPSNIHPHNDDEVSTPSPSPSSSPSSRPSTPSPLPPPSSVTTEEPTIPPRTHDPSSPTLGESTPRPRTSTSPPPKSRPLSITSLGLGMGMGNYLQSLQGSLGL